MTGRPLDCAEHVSPLSIACGQSRVWGRWGVGAGPVVPSRRRREGVAEAPAGASHRSRVPERARAWPRERSEVCARQSQLAWERPALLEGCPAPGGYSNCWGGNTINPCVVHALQALLTHSSSVCLQCPSLFTAQLSKSARKSSYVQPLVSGQRADTEGRPGSRRGQPKRRKEGASAQEAAGTRD